LLVAGPRRPRNGGFTIAVMTGGWVVYEGERRPRRDGGQRVRRAVPALVVGCALVACSQALAAGSRVTTVSVDCGSGVVVSQPATCTATVTDTGEAPRSKPTGMVNFGSDSEGTFTSTACELSPSTGTEQANTCQVEYDPTKIVSGTHTITASYVGDEAHAESSGSGTLSVGPRGTTVSITCGSGVVVAQTATCTAEGTPSTPTGTVSFSSDATGASFGSSGTCILSPLDSGTKSGCSVEYMPGQVGSSAHTITAAYVGDEVHAKSSGSGVLAVGAPPVPTPPAGTTTTPVPGQAVSPVRPTCVVRAREQWRLAHSAKQRARRLQVPMIVVTYTCDQSAAVRIGGVVTIAPTHRGRKVTKARTINLAPVSSSAVLGKTHSGVVVALPAPVAKAVRNGVRTAVAVTFRVFNANGAGVGTIRFRLLPPVRVSRAHR
jgi:hypothetical protein